MSTDRLLSPAKIALKRGDAQEALALLHQIPMAELKSGDALVVQALRGAAERASAEKR